jgi:hypothetical protein
LDQAQWLAAVHAPWMLRHLGDDAAQRKLRLFCCACARRIGDRLPIAEVRAALEAAEAFADARVTAEELHATQLAAVGSLRRETTGFVPPPETSIGPAEQESERYWRALRRHLLPGTVALAASAPRIDSRLAQRAARGAIEAVGSGRERRACAELVRDIFGNPFRKPVFDPSWRTSDVVAVARVIDETQGFGDLPFLCDALEEAGCADDEILNHGRGPGEHVRGCWLVDLVLDR